jgi:hypothetical protein
LPRDVLGQQVIDRRKPCGGTLISVKIRRDRRFVAVETFNDEVYKLFTHMGDQE